MQQKTKHSLHIYTYTASIELLAHHSHWCVCRATILGELFFAITVILRQDFLHHEEGIWIRGYDTVIMRYHHSIKLKDFSQQRGRITSTRVVLGEHHFFLSC